MDIVISGLYVYPVKSCKGISLSRADLDARGIRFDRAWMITDTNGTFITQREEPALSRIETAFQSDGLMLRAPKMPDLHVSLRRRGAMVRTVRVWGDECHAYDEGDAAAAWLGRVTKRNCRLVRMADDHIRPVVGSDGSTAFSDGYPLLVISRASLDDLNQRLDEALPMDRFRPNIVVSGCGAFDEDTWEVALSGSVLLRGMKPCERCVVTTTDQATGQRNSREPLHTLSRYRRIMKPDGKPGGVIFGVNVCHLTTGVLRLGDLITVRSRREAHPFFNPTPA